MPGTGRVLKRNHTTRVPHRIVCISCEPGDDISGECGIEYIHRWGCGVATFDRLDNGISTNHSSYSTSNRDHLWDWILSHAHKREKLWIFGHNLVYDLCLSDFWGLCRDRKVNVTGWIIDDPPVVVSARHNGCFIRMVSTHNWLNVDIRQLCECVKMRYDDIFTDPEYKDNPIHKCQMHCEIIRRFALQWIQVVKTADHGNFKPTIGGQSMASFTHAFISHPIIAHTDTEFSEVERQAYFGGRCCVNYVGFHSGPLFHLDVNSLYPAMMQYGPFPSRILGRADGVAIDKLEHILDIHGAVAECLVSTDSYQYPLRKGGRVYYPQGRYYTTLAGPELIRAVGNGQVLAVNRAMIYHLEPLFAQWCDYWLSVMQDAKRDGDAFIAKLSKAICNALSGKFAQRNSRWQYIHGLAPESDYKHWHYRGPGDVRWREMRAVAGCVQERVTTDDKSGGLCAISAYITSYGRCYMDQLRTIAKPGNVYYQDTDSLIVNWTGLNKLQAAGKLHATAIGSLKLVAELHNCLFDGPRRWQADGMRKASGIRKDSVEIAHGLYLQQTMQGANTLLATEPDGTVRVRPTEKRQRPLRGDYSVADDGWTSPIIFNE